MSWLADLGGLTAMRATIDICTIGSAVEIVSRLAHHMTGVASAVPVWRSLLIEGGFGQVDASKEEW